MRSTVTVMATDPAYSAMVAAATEALRSENLRISVRGEHNRKDGLLPIERYGLNFYVTGAIEGATAFKGSYLAECDRHHVRGVEWQRRFNRRVGA